MVVNKTEWLDDFIKSLGHVNAVSITKEPQNICLPPVATKR